MATIRGFEVFRATRHAGVEMYARADVEAMARRAGDRIPLRIVHLSPSDPIPPPDGLVFGYVRWLRADGSRLLADLERVSDGLAEQIRRGRYTVIKSEIRPYPQGLESVTLFAGSVPPVADLRRAETYYQTVKGYAQRSSVRSYYGTLMAEGSLPEREADEGSDAVVAHATEENPNMTDEIITITPDQVDRQILTEMRLYQAEHPGVTSEQAWKAVRGLQPELARAYDFRCFCTAFDENGFPVSGGFQGAATLAEDLVALERKKAQNELVRLAKDYLARHPSTPDIQAALRQVFKDHVTLATRAGYGSHGSA